MLIIILTRQQKEGKMTDKQIKQIESYIGHKLVSCVFKKPFATLKEVQDYCKRVNLHYYKCRYCGNYHTTKQSTYETIMDGFKNDRCRSN